METNSIYWQVGDWFYTIIVFPNGGCELRAQNHASKESFWKLIVEGNHIDE